MPIYTYRCPECEKKEDKLVSLSETKPILCSDCKSPMDRIFNPSGDFLLKGKGWFKTDGKY